jgi:hypothetical protein
VARDYGGSPEAWDLRARRHLHALPPGAPAGAVSAAVQAAVEVFEQGLQASPSSEMATLMLAFLQQQAAALEGQEPEQGSGISGEQQQQLHVAAEWLRLRTQRAFEEAEAAGLLSEALRLDGIAFFLHHGEAHAAMAAARFAVKALPQSAALWQQLIVLEAVLAADHLASSGTGGSPTQQQQGGSSSDDDEEMPHQSNAALRGTAAAATQHSSAPAQQRLEGVVLQALRAVPAADAAPVWLTGLSVLCGGGCSLHALSELLLDAAMRQSRGPVEVGACLPACVRACPPCNACICYAA